MHSHIGHGLLPTSAPISQAGHVRDEDSVWRLFLKLTWLSRCNKDQFDYGRGIQQRGYKEATTSCPLLRHTRRLQLRQRPHTHTLSLSHAVSVHTRYTTTNYLTTHILFPKSYLYIYDLRVIYISVLCNWSDWNRNRVFGHPVLPNFHPEGPVSQQWWDVSTHEIVTKRVHFMLTWKTQIWEKPR